MSKEHYAVIEPKPEVTKVTMGEHVLFHGDGVLALTEHHFGKIFPEVLYFPKSGTKLELFRKSNHHTTCPIKGEASYWDLEVDGDVIENAIWSYENPIAEVEKIRNFIAFDRSKIQISSES